MTAWTYLPVDRLTTLLKKTELKDYKIQTQTSGPQIVGLFAVLLHLLIPLPCV